MTALNREQIAIMQHTSIHAARGYYCGDSPDMQALVAAGLMESAGKPGWCDNEYFSLTPAGHEALKEARI